MSSLESFGRLLDETVAGEKLSASRVERVRDYAVKQFPRGEKAASVIIKVHRRAAAHTQLSSLYLFDAICRYAFDIVRKRASGFDYRDAEPPSGSSASHGTKQALYESAKGFLKAASGIVEEMVLSTSEAVRDDQKAKVVKVVDIWTKAGTFDEDQLLRLKGMLSAQHDKGTHSNEGVGRTDGKKNTTIGSPYGMLMEQEPTPEQQPGRTNTPPQIPSSLLALLGNKGGNGTTDAAATATKQKPEVAAQQMPAALGAAQLAMLQQIAQQNSHKSTTTTTDAASITPPNIPVHPGAPPSYLPPTGTNNAPPSAPVPDPTAAAAVSSSMSSAIPAVVHATNPESASRQEGSKFTPDPTIGDLGKFDFTVFDPTSPTHWVRFAQHWHNTYQYIPSNQECMWAMMSAIQSQMYMASYENPAW